MTTIPYDATRDSLYHPGKATNFFQLGELTSDAAICAEMSRLAYVKTEPLLEGYLQRADFRKNLAFGYLTQGLQAFVATRSDELTVVAFRGSEPDDPSDIFTDAHFLLTSWENGAGTEVGRVRAPSIPSVLPGWAPPTSPKP